MDINIDYKKTKSSDEAFELAKGHINPELLAKFKVKAEVSFNDKKKMILATGKGFDLDATFKDNSVELNLKMSLLLKPFRKTILSQLEKEFKKVV